jgi:hypothetical protein
VTITAEQLTKLLLTRFSAKYDENFLRINAEVLTTETIPELAAVFERILTSNPDTAAGWHRAMVYIDNAFYDISTMREPTPYSLSRFDVSTRPATPDEVRENATNMWSEYQMAELMEDWAFLNAHAELGNASDAYGQPVETLIHQISQDLKADDWHNHFENLLTDEYWRGLVALSIMGNKHPVPEMRAFISWAGVQSDLKAVVELSTSRGTIDPNILAPLLEYKDIVSPAILEGVL